MTGRSLAGGLVFVLALLVSLWFFSDDGGPDFMATCAEASGGAEMSVVVEPVPAARGHDLILYCVVDGERVLRKTIGRVEP